MSRLRHNLASRRGALVAASLVAAAGLAQGVSTSGAQATPHAAACAAADVMTCSSPIGARDLRPARQTRPSPWRRPRSARLTPQPCPEAPGGLCGTLTVPLERGNPRSATIAIGFELYPHTNARLRTAGTIVPNPGGPGLTTTGFRDDYRERFGPILDRFDLLLIDDRGRGKSAAIDCPQMQHGIGTLLAAVTACGRQLGRTASDYGAAAIADDVDAVRAALGIARIDYYGGSNGGVDVEAYAARHPSHLRSIVADAPFSSLHDFWEPEKVAGIVRTVTRVCGRVAACAAANPHPRATLRSLVRRIDRAPLTGTAYDLTGVRHTVRLDESTLLWNLLTGDAAGSFGAQGEIAAATRAWRRGDTAPLLRLTAENDFPFFGDGGNPTDFSAGDYLASFCTDTARQPWDSTAPLPVKRAQYRAAVAALPRRMFAPFSVTGWTAFLHKNFNGDLCTAWPGRHVHVVAADARMPRVPTLVLTGDLDFTVPTEAVERYAARFPNHTVVHILGVSHVPLFWGDCARSIIVHFFATLRPGDTTCARTPGQFQFVVTPDFPLRAHDAAPATTDHRADNDHSTLRDRRAAAAASATVSDVVKRFRMYGGDTLAGVGLRGGTFTAAANAPSYTMIDEQLHGVRFVRDIQVSGHVHLDVGTVDQVHATIHISGPGTATGDLVIDGPWPPLGNHHFTIHGTLGGRHVALLTPAT